MQLDMVLRLGVSPDRIVFANACKRPRDIRAAANKQVLQLPLAMKAARSCRELPILSGNLPAFPVWPCIWCAAPWALYLPCFMLAGGAEEF